MQRIELLLKQTQDAYAWADKLVSPITYDKWDIIPEVIRSNISWQVGHLIVSYYFHYVMVIRGHQMEILNKVPLKEYSELFTDAAPRSSYGKITPEVLLGHLR